MLNWANLFKRKETSGSLAKDRLQVVLIQDRISCSDNILESIKADIAEVLSKYAEIDVNGLNIELSKCSPDDATDTEKTAKGPILSANIPLHKLKRG